MTNDQVAISAAPREMTGAARKAAWGYPAVRFWWVVAGVLVVVMLSLLVSQVLEWTKERKLVRSGEVVEAVVFEAGAKLKGRPVPPQSDVDLTYEYGGKTYKVTGPLAERPAGTLVNGQTIRIRIDPESPKVWTSRSEPSDFAGRLVAPLMLLPAVIVTGLVAWWQRRRVAGVWVNGEARKAVVLEARQTPIAPLSQQVRCALADGSDKRLITVYVPGRAGKVKKGDVIWLVTEAGNAQRAVAAAGFQ